MLWVMLAFMLTGVEWGGACSLAWDVDASGYVNVHANWGAVSNGSISIIPEYDTATRRSRKMTA